MHVLRKHGADSQTDVLDTADGKVRRYSGAAGIGLRELGLVLQQQAGESKS